MGIFSNEHEIRALTRQIATLSVQVERLSALVELLARRQGVGAAELAALAPTEEPWVAEARQIKQARGPIPAIKLVRDRSGMGLREAKELVDRL